MTDLNIATQYDGTFDLEFLQGAEYVLMHDPETRSVEVHTVHGIVVAEVGDWLIRTPSGRLVNRKELH